eukprot:1158427-Pelagomonas_calceolata.AAC.1
MESASSTRVYPSKACLHHTDTCNLTIHGTNAKDANATSVSATTVYQCTCSSRQGVLLYIYVELANPTNAQSYYIMSYKHTALHAMALEIGTLACRSARIEYGRFEGVT